MKSGNDCIYYYHANNWHKATLVPAYLGGTATTLQELRAELERAGYPCVAGNSNIGAPDGPPRAASLARVRPYLTGKK